jgi:large repetitive protein
MRRLLIGLFVAALLTAIAVEVAPASPGKAVAAKKKKKCGKKKKKRAAASKKGKCKKAPSAPTTPPTTPASPGGGGGPVSPPPPADADADGVPDSTDNCVSVANVDQADADGDQKGDVCDACPADANPGDQGCPATIYDVTQGTVPNGTSVRIANALVMAVQPDGDAIWVQYRFTDPEFNGSLTLSFDGLEVDLTGVSTAPEVGQRVTIDGIVGTQLLNATALTVTGDIDETPDVVPVPPLFFNDGTNDGRLNGELVNVSDGVLSAHSGDDWAVSNRNDFTVAHRIIGTLPDCPEGSRLTLLQGIADIIGGELVLLPRTSDDIECAPGLTGLTANPSVCIGVTGAAGTVTLTAPAQGNTEVTLVSSDPSALTVPGSVTVPDAQSSASFPITGVAESLDVTITAILGDSSKTAHTSVTADAC